MRQKSYGINVLDCLGYDQLVFKADGVRYKTHEAEQLRYNVLDCLDYDQLVFKAETRLESGSHECHGGLNFGIVRNQYSSCILGTIHMLCTALHCQLV